DILKIDVQKLGVCSNFFELGGNSLLVVKMLTLVSNNLGLDLSLSQFIAMPTIATLSAQIEFGTPASQSIVLLWEQLKKDVVLDADLRPLQEINSCILSPKSILLTGASGFVGAHILDELIHKTTATVYCLVRASTVEDALRILVEKLKKYNLSSYQHISRIVPVLGDLGQAKLGLSNHDYDQLAKEVDALFHVGAWVHHVYDYNTLCKTNVQSVKELLKMAVDSKNKAFHFVSTLATTLISPIESLPSVDYASIKAYLNLNGYLTTKWVAEQLIKEASSRGIMAHVYRPGNVVSGCHGVYEAESNHTLLRLKGMLQLEKGLATSQEMVEMMPVDLLAKAIVVIAKNPLQFSYNLNNSHSISWFDYLQIAKNKGYRFDFIHDEEEWEQIISNLNEQNALYKLSHIYKIRSSASELHEESPSIIPDYIIETPSYVAMIEQQLTSLIAGGFLEKPRLYQ
ncbi:MAG: thioester reductase domain-containing protein, partial [Legionella longbeachae]|nr:thioester reductase domain-containing protein [Legionella longbeachae]